jgi:hypothetical protein
MAEYTAGHRQAVEIVAIAAQLDWVISDGASANAIHAVAALSAVYRSSPEEPGRTLREVLTVVSNAWGHHPDAVNAHMLAGMASLLNNCSNIDHITLARKLANHEPSSILGKGRGLREAMRCKVAEGVDQVIRGVYNSGKKGRANRLGTWADVPRQAAVQEQVRT